MKLITKRAINKIKNNSLNGSTHVFNVLINVSTLALLQSFYKEGLIQSINVYRDNNNTPLFFVDIYFRIMNGVSLLRGLKFFNSKNTILKLKNIDRLNFKQATIFVSTHSGITTLHQLKKKRQSGGVLLLSC